MKREGDDTINSESKRVKSSLADEGGAGVDGSPANAAAPASAMDADGSAGKGQSDSSSSSDSGDSSSSDGAAANGVPSVSLSTSAAADLSMGGARSPRETQLSTAASTGHNSLGPQADAEHGKVSEYGDARAEMMDDNGVIRTDGDSYGTPAGDAMEGVKADGDAAASPSAQPTISIVNGGVAAAAATNGPATSISASAPTHSTIVNGAVATVNNTGSKVEGAADNGQDADSDSDSDGDDVPMKLSEAKDVMAVANNGAAAITADAKPSAPTAAANHHVPSATIAANPAPTQSKDSEPVPPPEAVGAEHSSGAEATSVGGHQPADAGPRSMEATPSVQPTELDKVRLKFCSHMMKTSRRVKDAGIFKDPVDPVKLNIPTYFDVIKKPIDISTIIKRLDTNQYQTYQQFKDDLDLMFTNCYTFNGRDGHIGKIGQNMEKYYQKQLEKLPSTVPVGGASAATLKKRPSEVPIPVQRPKRDPVAPVRDVALPVVKKPTRKLPPELKNASQIIRDLMKNKLYHINSPFLEPVDPIKLGIPNYPMIIKNPMDLSTILRKSDAGRYMSGEDFEADVRLMFTNCYTFNPVGSAVYEMGQKLEMEFDKKWGRNMASAQLYRSKVSARREDHEDDSSSEEDAHQNPMDFIKLLQTVAKLTKKKKKKDKKSSSSSMQHMMAPPPIPVAKPKKHKSSSSRPKGSSAPKMKGVSDDEVKEVTYDQKKELSEKIGDLSPERLQTVYDIIRSGVPHLDTQSGQDEIELDIDSLDNAVLYKLYKFVAKSTKKPASRRSTSGSSAPKKPSSSKAKPAPTQAPAPPKEDSSSGSSSSSGSDSDSGSGSD
ncbi:hypothetical protein HK101_008319 [Irineochytrium annulatum]|nr:hypothetical protein HK101_008319 [Irineochytrium annulatum]